MSADTQDAVSKVRQMAADRMHDQQQERLELHGTARELFVNRYQDSFSLTVHGTEVEFYRPVNSSEIDLSTLDEDVTDRIERGSQLLDEFEHRQRALLRGAQSGEMSLEELLDESIDGVDLMCKILATHALDESLADPRVWKSIYRNEEALSSLFEDFINEGASEQSRKKLGALDNLLSGSSSTN